VLARLGESSMRSVLRRSAACALQQQRSRHTLDVRGWLVLARLGECSMQPALRSAVGCLSDSSARATPSTRAIG
jgi:hypothetical protein